MTFNEGIRRVYTEPQLNRVQPHEIEDLGNVLWKGPALSVAEPVILPACDPAPITVPVTFYLEQRHLPFGGNISPAFFDELKEHIRSRWAHGALEKGTGLLQQLIANLEQHGPLQVGELRKVQLPMKNLSLRPLNLSEARPFHFYAVPEGAYVIGEELDAMVGSMSLRSDQPDPRKKLLIAGEEGETWRRYRETLPDGTSETTAVFLRIARDGRVWAPWSDEPLKIPEEGSFAFARELLYEYVFRSVDKPDADGRRMPPHALWIGHGPHIWLSKDIYLEIDRDAYLEKNGHMLKVANQTESPLLEHRINDPHSTPNFEMIGNADWAKVRIVRTAEEPKQG